MSSVARDSDLTARARIRDAAVRRFAIDGLAAPLRAIAADADVSPALILHHFGSREGLRAACDEYVIEEIFAADTAMLSSPDPASALAWLNSLDTYGPLVGYLIRLLRSGDTASKQFVDAMVAQTETYLADGVAEGTIRPSRMPEARARLIVKQALGSLLLSMPAASETLDLGELEQRLHAYTTAYTLPALELYTEGLLTDTTTLDAFAEHLDPETEA